MVGPTSVQPRVRALLAVVLPAPPDSVTGEPTAEGTGEVGPHARPRVKLPPRCRARRRRRLLCWLLPPAQLLPPPPPLMANRRG